jgi:cell division protein FtsB
LVVLGVIAALYLLQANQIAATISDIHRLDDEAEQLRQDNAALIVEIATLEDINHLKGRAVELGFGPSTNLHYLRVPSYSTASPPQ